MNDPPGDPGEIFREYLVARGKRVTREREEIIREVFLTRGPFNVDQLLSRMLLRSEGRRISLATAYRTLTLMVSAGVLQWESRDDRDARTAPFSRTDLPRPFSDFG